MLTLAARGTLAAALVLVELNEAGDGFHNVCLERQGTVSRHPRPAVASPTLPVLPTPGVPSPTAALLPSLPPHYLGLQEWGPENWQMF